MSKINSSLLWIIIASVIVVGWQQIKHLKSELEAERKHNVQLQESVDTLSKSYATFATKVKEDIQTQHEIYWSIISEQEKNRRDLETLRDTFNYSANGKARDMDKLIEGKPTLLQRRINDATKEVGQKIEAISNYSTK